MKRDVLLLADVFESFIKTSLIFYKLDPCYYFSSPGLSWDAMLEITGVKLELTLDVDKYYFPEEAIREGNSNNCKKYSEANNKFMKNYDLTKESKYIMDLDENNLYVWGMWEYLPNGEFQWVKNVDNYDGNSISETSSTNYILKVDLQYTDELHKLHNAYLLAPKKCEITYNMPSNIITKLLMNMIQKLVM